MKWFILPCLSLALISCGGTDRATVDNLPSNPFAPNAVSSALGGTAVTGGAEQLELLEDDAGTVINPDEIVYTDPDTGAVPELEELLANVPTEGPWRQSYTKTFREAKQSDKPVLIWFTDSQNSPPSKALSQELFSNKEFEEWAIETFVRLEVDQRISGSRLDDEGTRKSNYVEEMKKRYRVHGTPTLLVLTPSGEVIGRYKGYSRGQAKYRWGQLRQAADLARRSHEQWKQKMEKKGYRTWSNPQGKRIMAKLIAYKDGRMVMIEPDGNKFLTRERNLSSEDRAWIAAEKAKRGMQ